MLLVAIASPKPQNPRHQHHQKTSGPVIFSEPAADTSRSMACSDVSSSRRPTMMMLRELLPR
jgi:hypothetical protein